MKIDHHRRDDWLHWTTTTRQADTSHRRRCIWGTSTATETQLKWSWERENEMEHEDQVRSRLSLTNGTGRDGVDQRAELQTNARHRFPSFIQPSKQVEDESQYWAIKLYIILYPADQCSINRWIDRSRNNIRQTVFDVPYIRWAKHSRDQQRWPRKHVQVPLGDIESDRLYRLRMVR